MIGKLSPENILNLNDIRFIIVYDKFSKPASISLYNQLSKKFKCAIWDKKHFLAEEPRIPNSMNVILLNEDLIKENFANPSLKGDEIVPGMDSIREGNRIGIVFNETKSPKKLSNILEENWVKYTARIVGPIAMIGVLAGVVGITWLLTLSQKKKIKFKLYMDAVDALAKSKLQEILNE